METMTPNRGLQTFTNTAEINSFFVNLNNTDWFAYNILGLDLWSKQRKIAAAVADPANRNIAVASCRGAGKSELLTTLAIQYAYVKDYLVLITAPTAKQIDKVIFRYIKDYHRRFQLGGEALNRSVKIFDSKGRVREDVGIYSFTGIPENISGFHGKKILLLVDEAPGIKQEIFPILRGILSNNDCKLVMIGNPTSMLNDFYKAFGPNRSQYWQDQISIFDTPNFTGELKRNGQPYLELIDKLYESEMREMYGVDSPDYQIQCLANFVSGSDEGLFNLKDIEACRKLKTAEELEKFKGRKKIGVDVARYGADKSAFAIMWGNIVEDIVKFSGMDGPDIAGRLIQYTDYAKVIEGGNMNSGVIDHVKRITPVTEVDMAGTNMVKHEYLNNRAELYFALSHKIKKHEIDLSQLSVRTYNMLVEEMTAITYDFSGDLKKKIVDKKKIKKLIQRSPDSLDALVLAQATAGEDYEEIKKKILAKERQINFSDIGI